MATINTFDPGYLSLSNIITEIKSTDPAKRKVAIAITGGGARGAYEAGAMEAIISALFDAGIKPDAIVGTSAGAIVSTTTFIDLLYPKKPSASSSNDMNNIYSPIYTLRVSDIWRKISDKNQGAEHVVDKKWLIEYATGEKALPHEGLFNAGEKLSASFDNFKNDLDRIKKSLDNVNNIVKSYLSLIKFDDLDRSIGKLNTDLADLLIKIEQVNRLAGFLANGDLSVVPKIVELIAAIVGDILRLIGNIALKIPGGFLKDLIDSAISLIDNFKEFIDKLMQALATVLGDFGNLVGGGGEVLGDFLVLLVEIGKAVALLKLLDRFIGVLVIAAAGGVVLNDHILGNERLANLHSDLMDRSFKESKSIPLNTFIDGDAEILIDYKARELNEKLPELFLCATNLTTSRQMIFSVAKASTIVELSASNLDKGIWVVDLTKRTQLSSGLINLFHPHDEMIKLLTTATMTSTAIPMAFPPVKWKIIHNNQDQMQQTFNHICVDGGVLDNTPIDIAAYVGATHIISIELTPLVDPLYDDTINIIDKGYNLATVGPASFFSSMDGSLLSRISSIVDQNKTKIESNNTEDIVQIYRIAPLINRNYYEQQTGKEKKASIGILDFDGLYDKDIHGQRQLIMSIYDWFMQGYIDAMGLDLSNAKNYPIFQDYISNGRSLECAFNYKFFGNKFWRATSEASPKKLPPIDLAAGTHIYEKYGKLGGTTSFLGTPTTNEQVCADGLGLFCHFRGGSIYWHPSTGAHEIHGYIRDKWASLGWEVGYGYPITDETGTPDGIGRYNHFTNEKSIYWTRNTGACAIYGGIREKWASLGWENSSLGYPTSDEMNTPDGRGRMNHFQHGKITWYPDVGVQVVVQDLNRWIRCLFLDLLDREPEQGALNHWLELMNGGTSMGQVAERILRSPGYCTIVANSLYNQLLDRQSDPDGLEHWWNVLGGGASIQDVIVRFCESQEFKMKHPVPEEFVRSLYYKILGRSDDPQVDDPDGFQHQVSAINNGTPTVDIIKNFLRSLEYASNMSLSYFRKFLGRDSQEPSGWARAIQNGTPLQEVIKSLLVSEEYQQRSLSRIKSLLVSEEIPNTL